jgi:V8-like Glu-specific endopeptidase
MATKRSSNRPVTYKTHGRALKDRAAVKRKTLKLSESIYVAGGAKPPKVSTRVVPVEREVDGKTTQVYEVKVDISGIKPGERSFAPGLESVQVEKRMSSAQLAKHARLLEAHVPDHLPIDSVPRQIVRQRKRILARMEESQKYNTTIFGTDDRRVFQDTSYPWSAFGRCRTNMGPFSGVMVGPRHILTCNHGVDWTPPSGYAADWLEFKPSYYDGSAPFGTAWATHVYWIKKDNNDGFSNGDEDQYDYVVLVLNDRIGERTGWLGARRYADGWDGLAAWWHIGYPSDLTSMERPIYLNWFSMDGDNNQSDEHQAIYHQADVFPGQSGGPMFGFWTGDVGPRAVAVQSWHNSSTNGASGGGDLVDLVIRARTDHP